MKLKIDLALQIEERLNSIERECAILQSSLEHIAKECREIRRLHGLQTVLRTQSNELWPIEKMTFREFVKSRLAIDRRIRGLPLFHGCLDYEQFHFCRLDDCAEFDKLGDIPLHILARQSEAKIAKIRSVGRKSAALLKTIFTEYGIRGI